MHSVFWSGTNLLRDELIIVLGKLSLVKDAQIPNSQVVESISRRISLATRWMIHQRPDSSSEQYHVINYGIGGQIEVHLDNWGPGKHYHQGGARLAKGSRQEAQNQKFPKFKNLKMEILRDFRIFETLCWLLGMTYSLCISK